MSMVTSCPSCTTTFRVTPDQLKHRHGTVRCGQCSGVFDAFKTLATLPDEPLAQNAEPGVGDTMAVPMGSAGLQGLLDIGPAAGADYAARTGQHTGSDPARRVRWIWQAAVVVLLLALGLQLAFAFRDGLASALPATRALLERLCSVGGCTVSAPQRTDLIAIEASDLQADPLRANVVILTAALRNRGNTIVAHPALELTLTNTQDQAIARRIFLPVDYLEQPGDSRSGMRALAEVSVRLELETADLRPAGYRLLIFYP